MSSRLALHAACERLIGAAIVDGDLRQGLLRDPRGTALAFGLSPMEAEMFATIHAADLQHFAASLIDHLYGMSVVHVVNRSTAAG
jgi:hypothetical protein